MSRRYFDRPWDEERRYLEEERRRRQQEEDWDRTNRKQSRDVVHDTPRTFGENYGSAVGGTSGLGGVFTTATYGSGAEYYSITGMYDNPLLQKKSKSHRGKAPKGYMRTDDRIRDEVCEQLTRHPLIDASRMEVHVEKGEVTFTGEILDRRMKFLAEDIAEHVSGVKEIHNRLRLVKEEAA